MLFIMCHSQITFNRFRLAFSDTSEVLFNGAAFKHLYVSFNKKHVRYFSPMLQ